MDIRVYVPDKLYDRMRRFQHRLNLSQIVQQALEKEIETLEAMEELESGEVEPKPEGSQEERFRERCLEEGKKQGIGWALNASNEVLSKLEADALGADIYMTWASLFDDKHWGNYMVSYRRKGEMIDIDDFAEGFVHGALQVWERIKKARG